MNFRVLHILKTSDTKCNQMRMRKVATQTRGREKVLSTAGGQQKNLTKVVATGDKFPLGGFHI